MYNFFIHSTVEGHLDCFQFLVIENTTAMNMFEQVPVSYYEASFAYIPKNGLAQT